MLPYVAISQEGTWSLSLSEETSSKVLQVYFIAMPWSFHYGMVIPTIVLV